MDYAEAVCRMEDALDLVVREAEVNDLEPREILEELKRYAHAYEADQ